MSEVGTPPPHNLYKPHRLVDSITTTTTTTTTTKFDRYQNFFSIYPLLLKGIHKGFLKICELF